MPNPSPIPGPDPHLKPSGEPKLRRGVCEVTVGFEPDNVGFEPATAFDAHTD